MVERKFGPTESGSVEVITGSMFSGKTEEMIRRLRVAEIAGRKVQAFRPDIDARYSENNITSHSGYKFDAVPVKEIKQIKELLEEDTLIVAIDDVHFFNDEIIPFVQELANEKIRVIVAGLDMDSYGEPFGPVPVLMAQADKLHKYRAICKVCGEFASFTQRLNNDDPMVTDGVDELYEARCRIHHEVSGKL